MSNWWKILFYAFSRSFFGTSQSLYFCLIYLGSLGPRVFPQSFFRYMEQEVRPRATLYRRNLLTSLVVVEVLCHKKEFHFCGDRRDLPPKYVVMGFISYPRDVYKSDV